MQTIVVVALAFFSTSAALAQTEARRDPSDPQAPVPAAEYRSVFTDYQPYRDPDIAKWHEVNNQVGGPGSQGGHAPVSSGAKPLPKSEAPLKGAAQKPSAGGHGGRQ